MGERKEHWLRMSFAPRLFIRFSVMVVVALSGCMHRTNNLGMVDVDIGFAGRAKVTIVTHDQRPSVISGERLPTTSGVIRAAVGIPYPIKTASGQNVAWELTSVLDRTFKNRGFVTMPINVQHSETPAQVIQKLAALKADRSVLVTIREWHNDRYMQTTSSSDLEAKVFDANGNVLGHARVQTTEDLQHRPTASESDAAKLVEAMFQRQVSQLINHPQITEAFTKAHAVPVPVPTAALAAPQVNPAAPAFPPAQRAPENTAAACRDRADNDGDGLVDCADRECQVMVFCANAIPPR